MIHASAYYHATKYKHINNLWTNRHNKVVNALQTHYYPTLQHNVVILPIIPNKCK